MLQMVKYILLIITTAAFCGCNNHFELKGLFVPTGDVVDKRFEESSQMNENLKSATLEAQEDYVFYAATDPHIEDTYRNLSTFNDRLKNDTEASFGVIPGDCIEVKDNLPKYLEALTYNPATHAFSHEIFHILGNHDIYFNGWDDFSELIGPSVYWFEVSFPTGKDLFISLDTASGTLGKKQTRWLKSFLSENRSQYRHCIILTHVNFFYTDNSQTGAGNMPIEESYGLIDFLGSQNVSLVLQGHDHYREDLTYANVRYTVLGAIHDLMEEPEYLKVRVNQDNISLEWKYLL